MEKKEIKKLKFNKDYILRLPEDKLFFLVNYHFERLERINKHRNLSFIEMNFVSDVYEFWMNEISVLDLRQSLAAYLGCLFRKNYGSICIYVPRSSAE